MNEATQYSEVKEEKKGTTSRINEQDEERKDKRKNQRNYKLPSETISKVYEK